MIDHKLRAQDITLSDRQLATLTEHVLQGTTVSLTLDEGRPGTPDRDLALTFT